MSSNSTSAATAYERLAGAGAIADSCRSWCSSRCTGGCSTAPRRSACLGLMLVAVGATGATVHGGYDLANSVHAPVTDVLAEALLPSPIDARGLLTFGVSGLGLLVLAWQSRRSGTLPANLSALGMAVGALLILVYLGRLIILTPTNLAVAIPAAATGLMLSPLFYIWLGRELRRR